MSRAISSIGPLVSQEILVIVIAERDTVNTQTVRGNIVMATGCGRSARRVVVARDETPVEDRSGEKSQQQDDGGDAVCTH